MTDGKLGVSTMTQKKIWTAPAIQVIPLNSARLNNHGTNDDGYGQAIKS